MISLITTHITGCCQFTNVHILQGSVAIYIGCGGIFKYQSVANFSLSLSMKEFLKWLTFGEVMGKSLVTCFLLTHGNSLFSNTTVLPAICGK